MPITFKEAKDALAQYAGKGAVCPANDKKVAPFVRQVMEYMLISGAYGNLRKFCFCAVKGCFTAPFELEVPLKVKIDGEVGSVWDKWFEFHTSYTLDDKGCIPADKALFEDPNYYHTIYDLPSTGSSVGVLGTCDEDSDARIIVQGVDAGGRDVFTVHNGEQISGEYLSIQKNLLKYTTTRFSKITGILKSKTNGYVGLYAVSPEKNTKQYLSEYTPLEEKPSYRRFRLASLANSNTVKVSIIGRIRLKPAYADTDFIPFDNMYALVTAAQSTNANYNDNVEVAVAKDKIMQDLIERENSFKRVQNGQPVEVFRPLSGGAISNIVNTRRRGLFSR